MNVIFLVAGNTQFPGAAALLPALVTTIAAHSIVRTSKSKVSRVVAFLNVTKALGTVATRALFAVLPLVYGGFVMTATTLLRCGFEAAVSVAVHAQRQGVRPIDLKGGLLVVVKARRTRFRVAPLALRSKRVLMDIVFLVAPSSATSARSVRESRIGMAVDASRNDLVPPVQWKIGVLLVGKFDWFPLPRAVTRRARIAERSAVQGVFVTSGTALGRGAFVHVAHVASLALDLCVLQCEREPRLLSVKNLERLLRHALLARLGVAAEALFILVLATVRFFVLVTAEATNRFHVKPLKI